MAAQWPAKVLILFEASEYGGDFGLSFAHGFRDHGCEVSFLHRAEPWDEAFDLVLAYGPFSPEGSMLPAGRRLLALPEGSRPVFVWWLTEGTPDRRLPPWLVEAGAGLRLAMDDIALGTNSDQGPLARLYSSSLWSRAHRLRIFGQMRWFQARGILDVLAVTATLRSDYLRRHGFQPVTIPLGYHPDCYGTDLGLARDRQVCFLGQAGSGRRQRVLDRVRRDLRGRGIEVSTQSNLYDAERTRFLNRTKIILNILRTPYDFVGQRFLLGAANKALVISEPLKDVAPFEVGRHLVAAPIDELAETVKFYLRHDAERQKITDEAYRFVTRELAISQMVGRILDTARAIHRERAELPQSRHCDRREAVGAETKGSK
jgi:hypothetical protein